MQWGNGRNVTHLLPPTLTGIPPVVGLGSRWWVRGWLIMIDTD